jgi:Uma2 family endonuclease
MTAFPARRRFTVAEFYRMGRAGVLHEDDRVELIGGEIIVMSPIGDVHAACVNGLTSWFVPKLGERAIVSVQNPIWLSDSDMPQPDLALLRPREDRYASGAPRPEDVFVVMEVSDTSLRHDRRKLVRYAAAGIPESWLFNLRSGRTEVHRDPAGGQYREVRIYDRDASISPLAFPDLVLPLAAVIPQRRA